MYDLSADPMEQTDISEANPEIRSEMAYVAAKTSRGFVLNGKNDEMPSDVEDQLSELGYLE